MILTADGGKALLIVKKKIRYLEIPQKLILILNTCIMLSRKNSDSSRPNNY